MTATIHSLAVARKMRPHEAQRQLRQLITLVRDEVCGGDKKRFADFFKTNFPEKPNFLEQNDRQRIVLWLKVNITGGGPQFGPCRV